MGSGEDNIGGSGSEWTHEEEALLLGWRGRAYASQSAYYARASAFLILNYLVGVPVVIVTTITGTAILANQDTAIAKANVPEAVGVISVVAAVLVSLQTFLRLGEKSAFNAVAGSAYSMIRREIEQVIALPPHLRGAPKEAIETIRKDMNQAGDNSPPIGQARWERYARRFGVKEPPPTPGRARGLLGGRRKPDRRSDGG